MAESFYALLFRARMFVLASLAVLSVAMGFCWSAVKVESRTIDLFPATHPYVETFKKYSDVFGGASRVVIQLQVKQGTIFERDTLEKIRRITKQVELLPAINNYQVLSIAQRKAKELQNDSSAGFRAVPVMWPEIPQSEAEIANLKRRILANRRLYGTLVSLDTSATLIVAGFFEDSLDPKRLYQRIDRIIQAERDENTEIRAIGRPMMVGFIMTESPRLFLIMGVTVASMILLLAAYFRNLAGVLVPVCAAGLSALCGMGFVGLVRHNFDPLVMVIPFIITARALSHSVQMVNRYLLETSQGKNSYEAAFVCATALFKPGTLAIVTDVVGILLIYLAPIPLLQKLSLMGAVWFTSIFLSGMVLCPLMLSLLPEPSPRTRKPNAFLHALLTRLGGVCVGPQRYTVFACSLLAMALGFVFAKDLVIGDVHPGTPMLWPDSRYNSDTERIARTFGNTEELTVVVEGETRDAIKTPAVLQAMEAFQRHMEELPEVGATSSLADLLPGLISILHGGDPKWELIPTEKEQSAFFLEMMYSSADPGDLTRFVTVDSKNANIVLFLRDHKGETLRRVVAHAKQFITHNPVRGAAFRLAGGYGGLLAAINEEVTEFDVKITLAAFGATLVCCWLAFRSLFASVFFLLPLIGSNYMTYALMGARGIGLDVNALPVVALGVGLGVDYGLYVVEAVQEHYDRGLTVNEAVLRGIQDAGQGVLLTGLTMACGLAFWAFSFLRFQADMGLLLLFWMTMSMLGGLVLLPAVLAALKPRFVFGAAPRTSLPVSGDTPRDSGQTSVETPARTQPSPSNQA
ncbi:MAG: MMPL family transporter [Myxococcales bacterium]